MNSNCVSQILKISRKPPTILGGLLLGLLIFSGCATADWKKQQEENRSNLLLLEMGMTPREVLMVMGEPNLNEAYTLSGDRNLRIFFYYTHRVFADGNETKEEMTPVIFENGSLVGWGEELIDSYSIDMLEVKNRYDSN